MSVSESARLIMAAASPSIKMCGDFIDEIFLIVWMPWEGMHIIPDISRPDVQ